MIGAGLVPLFEGEARKRQKGGQGGVLLQANLPEANEKGQARDKAAKLVGVSPRTVEHARKVLREATPEVVEAVKRGDVAVSVAAAKTLRPVKLPIRKNSRPPPSNPIAN